eukprot:gnl/Dysnectes_brevis/1241_a1385_2031.p1 GENE.gnl/Dysnectes_brevis/1241_a1385_2031~~gnl/Dysnectes_brevis/1241_a1385_2031.p1  ORF type:complete len:297 (-),score=97.70 gnl/Dysnectes_brevis/1241_a1385_2031:80-970(-)
MDEHIHDPTRPLKPSSLSEDDKGVMKRLKRLFGKAIRQFSLIEENDKVMLALSGGKDSWALLYLLRDFQRRAPFPFTIIPFTVNSGFPGFGPRVSEIRAHVKTMGMELHVADEAFPQIIADNLTPGTSQCSFCARLRRGTLYSACQELGVTKLALGHHRADIIESLLMSMMFNGSMWTQEPRVEVPARGLTVIRPLAYCAEDDLGRLATLRGVPIVSCCCPFDGDPSHNRAATKRLIADIEETVPTVRQSLIRAAESLFGAQRGIQARQKEEKARRREERLVKATRRKAEKEEGVE